MLLDCGVYVNLTLPPATPDGGALLRSSVTAAHEPAQVEVAAAHFIATAAALGMKLDAPHPPHLVPEQESFAEMHQTV
jgi:hypothetical protein